MTTYSISLDDLDLALLPMPTYRHNNFLKKEIYQFQVLKTAAEPTTLYTCHICAIELPAAFANEHLASVKHQANVRIASVAAERMRAFVSARPPPIFAKPANRFCPNCATEEEVGHNTKKEHRAAVILDSLLWDLMKAYVNDDDESKFDHSQTQVNNKEGDARFESVNGDSHKAMVAQEINKNESMKLLEEVDNFDSDTDCDKLTQTRVNNKEGNANFESVNGDSHKAMVTEEINKNESMELVEVDNYDSDTDCDKLTVSNAIDDQSIIDENIVKKDVAEKAINVNWLEHYKENLRQFIDDNDYFDYKVSYNISIQLNEYTLRNIDSNRFHSYQYINDNVKCIVCDCILNNLDAEFHKDDPDHVRRVAKIGNNGHYVREIDELYSHCILCNEKLKNVDTATHIQSLAHSLYEWSYTNTNQVNKAKRDAIEQKESGIEADEGNVDITIEYPYVVTEAGVRCLVCDCRVPCGEPHRDQHIRGVRHQTQLILHKSAKKPSQNAYGEILRKLISDEHFFEFKELTWDIFRLKLEDCVLETYTDRFHSFHPVGRDMVECQVCDIAFRSGDEHAHTYEWEHLQKVVNFENDGNFVRKINNQYSHCILCNDKVSNMNVARHTQSQGHVEVRTQLVRQADT